MSAAATVDDLIALALRLEYASEALYLGMEAKFRDYPEVAAFWRRYAAEEVGHARWLERLQKVSGAEQLATETDPRVMQMAVKMSEFSVESALKHVQTLEDAYELATDVENSETNAIFEFLIMNYYTDPDTVAFLRTQLREHINRLVTSMPDAYQSREARQSVKAAG